MTEAKISKLKKTFPECDESSLLELLISCDGSISTTESLLYESFPQQNKRIKLESHLSRQSNINSLLGQDESTPLNKIGNHSKPIYLYTKSDIETTIPYASIHFNFLPEELSNNLLNFLLKDDQGWSPQEFYLFGNACKSNHQSKVYSSKTQETLYYNGHKYTSRSSYTDDLKMTQLLIEDQVNKELQTRDLLPFQHQDPWKGELAVCNKFESKSNNLDWHSDRMTYIGPHPIIASFTLGATRDFRIRKQYDEQDGSKPPIYSIPLPHNTLLIMHAGFQEEFKHCVSSTTEFHPHPMAGSIRFNLTYRNYLKRFQDNLPMCSQCGNQMDLRRSFKKPENRGRYIWLCTGNYLGKECNGFHYANFNEDCLYTDNVDECSRWISRDDKAALKSFREMFQS
ncbi:hypothetical protein BN7_1690 [Wickerhamomyces ciferrii]|uniref:Fe2OG dioxygenase domain-containing protein n=1 Tax=Wickerhamomyces ciferrii (strain ATCC 14091 / BCRC 22168 / CBS 111 / JCM 3599 / NBRC 0793 / NRRL Y-1031 F-60-10) TaxID=1206466 RepID=K0KAW8_WICCF|nr:uncharacterized protein BN7_1690 [Wickerhamomyces ciferrii]CCH42145.1 hypothetical protein BN7_1690 [Wickerhamomyces ciferrii]